jgi:hypothetical protein
MLRDNVQHHLEGGSPTAEFEALHQLGDAMWVGKVSVSATQLRRELAAAESVLALSMDDFAVSLRTRAVCSYLLHRPEHRATHLVRELEWTVPYPVEQCTTLGDVFGSLHGALLQITQGAAPGDAVEVIDS